MINPKVLNHRWQPSLRCWSLCHTVVLLLAFFFPLSFVCCFLFFQSSLCPKKKKKKNPPCSSFYCNFLVWLIFGLPQCIKPDSYNYPIFSSLVDWVKLVMVKFLFHQNWFWVCCTVVWWNARRRYGQCAN